MSNSVAEFLSSRKSCCPMCILGLEEEKAERRGQLSLIWTTPSLTFLPL